MNSLINYGFADSPFGCCFIAFSDEGIHALHFPDGEKEKLMVMNDLKIVWSEYDIIENQLLAKDKINDIFLFNLTDIRVLFRGTPFRINVWKTLATVSFGEVMTYSEISQLAGNTKAIRAVASAIANNPVCYLIPCHRIIRKNGDIGQFRWTPERKQRMQDWEKRELETAEITNLCVTCVESMRNNVF